MHSDVKKARKEVLFVRIPRPLIDYVQKEARRRKTTQSDFIEELVTLAKLGKPYINAIAINKERRRLEKEAKMPEKASELFNERSDSQPIELQ